MIAAPLILLAPFTGFAADTISLADSPAIINHVTLKNAVQIRVTSRGQRLFSDHLMDVLTNQGIVVNENYFPAFNYVSKAPIKLDDLAKNQPEQFAMLVKVREFFQQYLIGIQFKDFLPSVQVGSSEYVADISRLSLVTDEALMKSLGKPDGAVLAVELSVRNLQAEADGVTVKDLQNPWIGQVGVQAPQLSLASKDTPMIARMPFYVRVDDNGFLQFQALKIDENIDQIPVEVKYQKLLLPEIEYKIVGQEDAYHIKMNDTQFKQLVDDHLPDGIKLVRQYVRDFLQNDFTNMLNEKAQASLKKQLEQVQSIAAPNTPPGDTRPALSLGLSLKSLNLVNSQWSVVLDAFLEDTMYNQPTPFWPKSGARGVPTFNFDPNSYDVGIAVDRAVFNRAIQLATNRNNFKKLNLPSCPADNSKPMDIELRPGPSIDFNSKVMAKSALEAPIALNVEAFVTLPDDMKSKFGIPILKDRLHLGLKYQAIIKPTTPGSSQLSIYPTGIDIDSVLVYEDSLRFIGKLFAGKVLKEVKDQLSKPSKCDKNPPRCAGKFCAHQFSPWNPHRVRQN
jgi:hypothetical protein